MKTLLKDIFILVFILILFYILFYKNPNNDVEYKHKIDSLNVIINEQQKIIDSSIIRVNNLYDSIKISNEKIDSLQKIKNKSNYEKNRNVVINLSIDDKIKFLSDRIK